MLEVYKIVHGQYDNIANISIIFHSGLATRGNIFKLKHGVFKYDLRKYFFTNRIVNLWNDLPDYVVMAKSTNSFKGSWINFGEVKKFFITGNQNSTLEPEKINRS